MFAAPWMLGGLLAIAAILLAHRLFRQPARRVALASFRLLPQSKQEPVAPSSWQDKSLMALRILMWALVALALARPHCAVQQELQVYQAPQAAFVVVDASARTHHRLDDKSLWQHSLSRARDLIQALPSGSWVHLMALEPGFSGQSTGMDKSAALDLLDRWGAPGLQNSFARQSMLELPSAFDALSQAAAKAPSSLPKVGYWIAEPIEQFHKNCPQGGAGFDTWICLGAYEKTQVTPPPHQYALRELEIQSQAQLGRSTFELRALIQDFGQSKDAPHTVPVQWFVDDKPLQTQTVTLKDGKGEARWYYGVTGNAPHRVRVQIKASDPFKLDDQREGWLTHQRPLQLLVVDGDPSELREHDEVYLLATALRQAFEQRGLSLRTVDTGQFTSMLKGQDKLPEDIDVLVLANVSALPQGESERLLAWVQSGLGLWITAGSRLDAAAYNQRLDGLLPLLLRSTNAVQLALTAPSAEHPVFSAFMDTSRLAGGQTNRVYLLEPDPSRNAQVALRFANGAPALVTREVGQGRVAFWSTSIDRAWTNLALHPGFVSLSQSIVAWLAKDQDTQAFAQKASVQVGRPLTLSSNARVQVQGPGQAQGQWIPANTRYRPPRTGLYQSKRAASKHEHRFAAVLSPKASPPLQGASVAAKAPPSAKVSGARSYRPIWRYLWPFLALALVVESLLRMLRLRR